MFYTIKVRRGIKHLIDMGLPDNVEKCIEFNRRKGRKRAEKMTAMTAGDIRAAVAWLTQEAGNTQIEHGGAAEESTVAGVE